MTNNEFYELYKTYQDAHRAESTSYTRTHIIANYLLPKHGEETPADITNMDINEIYDEMEARNLAQNTIFGTYAALYSYFRLAVQLGETDQNPVALARAIRPEL